LCPFPSLYPKNNGGIKKCVFCFHISLTRCWKKKGKKMPKINEEKHFVKKIWIENELFEKCKLFAQESSKTQRGYRSGGEKKRDLKQIQEDTLLGKIGEVIFIKFLKQFNYNNIKLDFEIYPRGKWDKYDCRLGSKTFSIKTIKLFSKWLLLEKKDVDEKRIYDVYILIKVSIKEKFGIICGYITKEELFSNDENTIILEKGKCIPNTSTVLDASNYGINENNLLKTFSDWHNLFCNYNQETWMWM